MRLAPSVLVSACLLGAANGLHASTDAIVLYSAGIDGILNDAKDAGFHQALVRMEEHEMSLPPGISRRERFEFQTMVKLLLSELDVRVAVRPNAPPHENPFTLTIRSHGNEGASPQSLISAAHQVAEYARVPAGVPDAQHPGFLRYNDNDPDPLTWIGLEKSNGVEQAVLSVGAPPEESSLDWSACGLPYGTKVIGGMLIDFNELQPLLGMAMMAQPQAGDLLKAWGLMGPDALRIQMAMGRDGELMHLGGRVSNWTKHFGQYVVDGGVRSSDIDRIPMDAVAAQVTRVNIRALLNSLIGIGDSMMPPLGRGPDGKSVKASEMASEQIKMMLGVNPKTELIDYLGDAVAFYRSPSTGGGGLMSMVMLVEASNPDGLATSIGLLAARANSMMMSMTEGYVAMSTWTHPDCGEVISLTFPGLPVPVELSMAVKENWLVATLTPQAMIAACRQFDARSSLRQARSFRQSIGMDGIGAMQINYSDTPDQMADGYGYMVGLASAISNYSRPKNGHTHSADLVVPTFGDLADDAHPCALLVSVDGDDVVYQGTADPSINVLMTGMMANIDSNLLLPMSAGVVMPAIMEARSAAMRAREISDRRAREAHDGQVQHGHDHHDKHEHIEHSHVDHPHAKEGEEQ